MGLATCCRCDFGFKNKRTSIRQEVLAGIMGWQTVVSSSALYAGLFVGDDEGVDQDATTEMFMVIGGLSTIAFALTFNVPFIVAPSVLYAPRGSGMSVGGHLATQAIANFAAAVFFFLALKLSFVSRTPTALRLGVGCGISMLIGVLGMRGVGLLTADSFSLQPFTWQSVMGLAVVSTACCRTPDNTKTRKWAFVIGVPLALTNLVYAVFDRSKFQGYSGLERSPLSSWGAGTFGELDFSRLGEDPKAYWFSVVRMFMSVVINISSVLLVLIDAVCLEEVHFKVKSSEKVDFSHTIGGTKKFRFMACSIPLMSGLGNLLGVTSQAAFVQSMIIIFAGGKTGLSAAVTGGLLIASTVLRPLLPVLVPGHISGALTVVITLRFVFNAEELSRLKSNYWFFTVVRMIDVSQQSNLLIFGTSILLVPFSFDFVDSVCIAAVLGFLCETGDTLILRRHESSRRHSSTVAISDERETAQELLEDGTLADAGEYSPEHSRAKGAKRRSSAPELSLPHLGQGSKTAADPSAESLQARTARASFSRALLYLHSSNSSGRKLANSRRSWSTTSLRRLTSRSMKESAPPAVAGTSSVHWGIALAAALELVLSAISDKIQGEE